MKKVIVVVSVLILLVVISLVIQKETDPPRESRVIIEHTYKTYIAPSCFNQADATNFLEDSTKGQAETMGYGYHDACTEEAFAPIKEPLLISLLIDIGFLEGKWDK